MEDEYDVKLTLKDMQTIGMLIFLVDKLVDGADDEATDVYLRDTTSVTDKLEKTILSNPALHKLLIDNGEYPEDPSPL